MLQEFRGDFLKGKGMEYFEEQIKLIKKKNNIDDFYLFAQTILDYEKQYGLDKVLENFKIDNEDLFFLKVYSDAIKIIDDKDNSLINFNLNVIYNQDEISSNN